MHVIVLLPSLSPWTDHPQERALSRAVSPWLAVAGNDAMLPWLALTGAGADLRNYTKPDHGTDGRTCNCYVKENFSLEGNCLASTIVWTTTSKCK